MPLRCKVFARLNNCANGDEADVSFVQTQKKRKVTIVNRITDIVHTTIMITDHAGYGKGTLFTIDF